MAQAIGEVSHSMGTVTATNSDGYEREVGVGGQIFEGDVVSAQGTGSGVGITFNNGCNMTLGGGETALIDETVYKLEFFDDAEVVVDLETAEGVSEDVAAAEEEADEEEAEVVEESDEAADEVFMAETDEADEDVDELETAGGDEDTEDSQSGEMDMAERIDVEETTLRGNPSDNEPGSMSQKGEHGHEDHSGLLAPDAPTISILNLDNNGFVNDTPVITGTAPEGSIVEVYDNNVPIESVTVDDSETFSVSPENLEDGEHSLTAQVTSPEGVAGEISDPITFTLDTVAPQDPTIESADITNITTPTISGKAESSSNVEVRVGEQTHTTQADEGGNWSVTLEETADGEYDISVVSTDQAGNASQASTSAVTIDSTLPDAPTIDPLDVTSDATPTITGTAEAGGTVSVYNGDTQVGETTADADGNWSYTSSDLEDGSYSITAVVTDSAGNTSGTSTVNTIVVDTAPPAEGPPPPPEAPAPEEPPYGADDPAEDPTLDVQTTATVAEDGSVAITFAAADVDGEVVSITASSEQGATAVNDDGTITFTPTADFNGEATVTVVVTDNDGATATQTSTVTVSPVNDAPTLDVQTTATVAEDGSVSITFAAADVDGEVLSTIATSDQGDTAVNDDGTITFTPTADFNGEATVTVVVTDIDGATATQTSTITVSAVNDAPTLDVQSTATVAEDGSVSITFAAADVDGDVLSTTASSEQGNTTVNDNGTITFTPTADFNGEATVTVVVTDIDGATATQTSTITVSAVNDAPTLDVQSTATVAEDGSVSITFSAADVDGEVVSTTASSDQGTTSVNDDGTITFTPTADFNGEATVTVIVTDNNDATASQTSTVMVNPVTDTPTIDALDLTNDSTPTITGTAEAGVTITLYDSDTQIAQTTSDADGSWSCDSTELEDGTHSITAVATDSAGNTSAASAVSSIVIDATAPDTPLIFDIDIDSAAIPVINGSAEAGSSVTVSVGDETYNVTSGDDSSWSVTADSLNDGSYPVSVTATDIAGNISQSSVSLINVDTSSVSSAIDYNSNGIEGSTYSIEDTTLLGISADGDFDPDDTSLNLDSAQTDNVTEHTKGYGVTGGEKGEAKAISGDEALVIQLDQPVDSVDVSINKLSFYESVRWATYDENMDKVDEGTFDGTLFGQQGTLEIASDAGEADFQYVVLTANDNLQGKVTSFFVEDISYEMADSYTYDMTIENVPMDDAATSLFIDGFDENIYLQDSEGNSVGAYEDGTWTLGEYEIQELGTINGTLNLQLLSEEPLEADSLTPTFTIVETSLDVGEAEVVDAFSPLSGTEGLFDFDSLEDVQRIDLSEDEINMNGLNLKDVMHLAEGENSLEIVSGEHDEHVLTLDAADWTIRTDAQGDDVSFESEGNAYNVYTSTDSDNQFNLIIDEMVTVVLES